jgi:hypothetical protein
MSNQQQTHIDKLLALKQSSPRDLRTLQIKLTFVGTQHKPLPSVVFNSFHHIVNLEWFIPMRSPDLHYANDEIAVWHFTATPEEIHSIVTVLTELPKFQSPSEIDAPYLSVMFALGDPRTETIATEVVLSRPNAQTLVTAVYDALDRSNGIGRMVITLQQQLLFA